MKSSLVDGTDKGLPPISDSAESDEKAQSQNQSDAKIQSGSLLFASSSVGGKKGAKKRKALGDPAGGDAVSEKADKKHKKKSKTGGGLLSFGDGNDE